MPVFAGGWGGLGGLFFQGEVGEAFFEANDDLTAPSDPLRRVWMDE